MKTVFMSALLASGLWALTFTVAPTLVQNSPGDYTITFAISETTDVEVSIVSVRDSGVVRHLAAGLLGSKAPAPLQANSLSQTLSWNGRDDFGAAVANPESLSVRVRAGMSTRLSQMVGEDLYLFVGGGRASPSIILQQDGSVILFGTAANNRFLRKYDATGNYARTLYPPAAGLPADSVTSYGINVIPGGGWAPKISAAKPPTMSNSFLNDGNTLILPGAPGKLLLINGNNQQTISTEGCFSTASKPLITSPAAPAGWAGPWGPQYFTASHDPRYLYLSGKYYGSVNMGCWLVAACDTGFWADGQVFKIDLETGVVNPWIRLDSVPTLAADRAAKIGGGVNGISAIHGTCIDDSGHVFVCDRLHQRISVYDTNAVLLATVACNNPDFVAVSKRTGALYVISRTQWTNLVLRRFSGWHNPGTATATTVLTTETGDGFKGASAVVLTEDNDRTNIWLGFGTIGFRLYRDDVTSFALVRDFSTGDGLMHYDRIAVDRATDRLFWETYRTGDRDGIYSCADWDNPAIERVLIDGRTHLLGNDITVGPNGGLYCYLYPGGNDYYSWPVYRYAGAAGNYAPLNYANTGKNISTNKVHFEGTNHRGLAVGWQGQVAATDYTEFSTLHDDLAFVVYPDTGFADTTYHGSARVTHTTSKSSGVRFDAAGNMYVGVGIKGSDWQVTPGFETDNFFTNYCGSIVKYAPGDTGMISGNTAVGASKVFPQPFGTYGGYGASGWCTCWNPRFDADPYGRLYIPNAATSSVAVADNEGNTLHTFGRYGNTDSRGGLEGPGEVVPGTYVPLAWPYSTAASEDYVYVSDWVNARILRVKIDYELDNIPGLTEHNSAAATAGAAARVAPTLTAAPNPFNPAVTITLSMKGAKVGIYDARGRKVADLSDRFMSGNAVWNAAGLASGVYIIRAEKGTVLLNRKIVFSK